MQNSHSKDVYNARSRARGVDLLNLEGKLSAMQKLRPDYAVELDKAIALIEDIKNIILVNKG